MSVHNTDRILLNRSERSALHILFCIIVNVTECSLCGVFDWNAFDGYLLLCVQLYCCFSVIDDATIVYYIV